MLLHLPEETHSPNKDTQLSRCTQIYSLPSATRQVIMTFTSLSLTVGKVEIEKDLGRKGPGLFCGANGRTEKMFFLQTQFVGLIGKNE